MNIFYLQADPVIAASYFYDKHKVKMILESAQILCTSHHHYAELLQYDCSYIPYRKTHYNHPVVVWARKNNNNYRWLFKHMMALGDEYTKRYGKNHLTIIKCSEILKHCPKGMPDGPFTEPPQCMPDQYKIEGNAVMAYWNYYEKEKFSVRNKNECIRRRTYNE